MDIRIDGLHERAFARLMERNGEKTIAAMTRILIRDAAIEAGVWNEAGSCQPTDQPQEAIGEPEGVAA